MSSSPFAWPTTRRELLFSGGRACLSVPLIGLGAAAGFPVTTSSLVADDGGFGPGLGTERRERNAQPFLRDRSVIFLFLHGGPSQIETFDPKMGAPAEVRSATGELATKIPGITFGTSFPRLAALADRFTIVRSFQTGDGNHDIKPIVSRDSFGASLGAVLGRVAGTTDPHTGVPQNVVLYPRAVDESTQTANLSFGDFTATGNLGPGAAPIVPTLSNDAAAGGGFQQDLQLAVPPHRFANRRSLLEALAGLHVLRTPGAERWDVRSEQAQQILLSDAADAFRIANEPTSVITRYDTAPWVRPDQINQKWQNYNNYVDNAKSLGKLLLLARRLCERGSRFVTVTTNFVWDMHADINNAPMEEGMRYMGPPLDYALAALIEDCEQRGLQDRITVVCCGEMGRTPKLNALGGRDHWGELAPLLLYGAGIPRGQAIGQSDPTAAQPASEPVTIRHLTGTLLHSLFDVGRLRLQPALPPDLLRMLDYPQIPVSS